MIIRQIQSRLGHYQHQPHANPLYQTHQSILSLNLVKEVQGVF